MKVNIVGMVAWVLLGLIGLVSTVDLGFGPIVICPQCGGSWNAILGVILILIAVAAFATNRAAAARTGGQARG